MKYTTHKWSYYAIARSVSCMKRSLVPLFSFLFLVLFFSTAINAQITSTTAGGNWSATTTWAGGVVPTAADNVTIADGASVVIDVDATITSLTVGQGISGSGILKYSQATV